MRISHFPLLAVLMLVGCKPEAVTLRGPPAELSAMHSSGDRDFSAGDVVTWAQLDDTFLDRSAKLEVGAADGKKFITLLKSDGTPQGAG